MPGYFCGQDFLSCLAGPGLVRGRRGRRGLAVIADRVVELDKSAVDRADHATDKWAPHRLVTKNLERRVPGLGDQRVEPAADPETERGLEDADPGRGGLILDEGPQRPADQEADQHAYDAERQPGAAEAGRVGQCEGTVADGCTDQRALEKSDEELDHL